MIFYTLLEIIIPILALSWSIILLFRIFSFFNIDKLSLDENPLHNPLISIIICYILSTRRESKNFYYQKWGVLAVGFSILTFAEIMVRYSGKSNLYTSVYYVFPPLILFLNYLNLIRIFKFENLVR